MEGYFDAIGLHQAGVRHAVALCSTALTAGHLQALSRAEAKELILLLDGDQAGPQGRSGSQGPCSPRAPHARGAAAHRG